MQVLAIHLSTSLRFSCLVSFFPHSFAYSPAHLLICSPASYWNTRNQSGWTSHLTFCWNRTHLCHIVSSLMPRVYIVRHLLSRCQWHTVVTTAALFGSPELFTCLPPYLPIYLPVYLPVCKRVFLPVCVRAVIVASMYVYYLACLPVSLSTCLLACLLPPACLLCQPSLPVLLACPACLPAFVCNFLCIVHNHVQ